MRKKVGISTWHYFSNFGSALQGYALQKTLKDNGCEAIFMNYHDPKYGLTNAKNVIKEKIKYFLSRIFTFGGLHRRFYNPFYSFRKNYFCESNPTSNKKELTKSCKGKYAIICGSDQIWAPNVFNSVYMLDFVPANVKKVSYAASIGLNDIPDELCPVYSKLLSTFNSISVREKLGAELLETKCKIQAQVVLDPTLLIEQSHWQTLEKPMKQYKKDKYLFCYFLNANHTYKDLVIDYAKRNSLRVIGWSSKHDDQSWMELLNDCVGPCEFLWLVHHAHSIITDSYHGTIFSLLYHKDFLLLERFLNVDKICQNSRIYQLDEYFGIGNRIIRSSECYCLEIPNYDYSVFENNRRSLKESSLNYLRTALDI